MTSTCATSQTPTAQKLARKICQITKANVQLRQTTQQTLSLTRTQPLFPSQTCPSCSQSLNRRIPKNFITQHPLSPLSASRTLTGPSMVSDLATFTRPVLLEAFHFTFRSQPTQQIKEEHFSNPSAKRQSSSIAPSTY